VDRRPTRELRRKLDHRFGDEHGDWVEVACVRFEAKTLRFERDRTAPAERVNNGRWSVRIAAPNLCYCLPKDLLVVRGLPGNKPFDDVKQTPTFSFLICFGREQLRVGGRVINQLGKQDCPTGRKWAARPPKMKRAGMAVPDALFPRSLAIDDVEWQGNLNQLGWHHTPSGETARCQ